MENEHSQTNANNLDETVISTENSISTCVEDTADQSVLEIINEIPIIEVLEETASFVVEDTGVIHIRKEPVSTINSVNEKQEEQTDKSEKTDKANGPEITTDIKKEDSVLHKNESTIADVYLQLDITENLDTYLEKERARQLSLSKSIKEKGDQKEMDPSDRNKEDASDDATLDSKKKHSKTSKKNESKSTDESSSVTDVHDVTVVEVKTEAPDTEAKNSDSKGDESEKSEKIIEADKKDNRFLWVSNINKTTKATALKMHLSTHGKVQMTKIVTDGVACFGYAVFETHEDANNCMKNLQDSMFEDREIHLSDKVPEKKQIDKHSDKDVEKKKNESKVLDRRDINVKSEIKKKLHQDPLTLKTEDDRYYKRYSEERRRLHDLERRRIRQERLSMERREIERKRRQMERERETERERERERKREKEREREREVRRRERIEQEERKKIEMKIEKERKKLEYERQLIEKEKLELLRYKRKLLCKEKEPDRDDRVDHKKHRSHDEYSRKKYSRTEENPIGITQNYWKADTNKPKTSSFEIYKKPNQEICVAPPPPPILSSDYHERDRQWNERKNYDNRPKNYGRKMEDGRAYGAPPENRQSYPDRSFPKEASYKNKNFETPQNHNFSWTSGYNEPNYKGQNIPVIRSEPTRSMPRHQNYQGEPCGAPMQNYFPGSNYRRTNDFFAHRVSERKY